MSNKTDGIKPYRDQQLNKLNHFEEKMRKLASEIANDDLENLKTNFRSFTEVVNDVLELQQEIKTLNGIIEVLEL